MGQSLFALLILSMAIMSFGELKVKYQWKYLDYDFDSTEQKENAINSGIYNRSKCMLYDADKADDGRIFLTTPKHIGSFSPATLVTITNKTGPGGPLLRPYPNWNSHNNTRCNDSMANVIYIQIRCNHLFAMDNGKSDKEQLCNPKLLIFDLKDDKLVKIIPIPSNVATNQTGFGTMAIPFIYIPDGECTRFWDKMIIFISDMEGSGLVVYNLSTNRMCRVESDYMKPTDTFFTVGGFNFTHVASTFALTILCDELYYAPMSGNEIYKIKIETLLKCPDKKKANEESKLAIKLSSHTLPITTVGQEIIYTSLREMSMHKCL
ncbi:PREDICTED: major royal jelly protein 3-like [Wasmannia auropunctata]|uniref:major royal jelly protein 3-like n=1 Tax=Wasmannia auropunctata TaxID=64793 RepID=UPI0005EE07D4|nr:PREDICTED: major royal jelly protein 3-like [Wasmannia auropunctata]